MATNGRSARGESMWIERATISFPDPVSPVISTDAVEGAAISTCRITSCIAADEPTSSAEFSRVAQLARQRRDRLLVAHASERAIEQRAQNRTA